MLWAKFELSGLTISMAVVAFQLDKLMHTLSYYQSTALTVELTFAA